MYKKVKEVKIFTNMKNEENSGENSYEIIYNSHKGGKYTKVIGIKYKVSDTGDVMPIISFEEIDLNGVEHNYVVLDSIKNLLEMNLVKGDLVEIRCTKDLNPYISQVIKRNDIGRFIPIVNCPSCGSILSKNYDKDGFFSLKCENENCKEKLFKKIQQGFKMLGLKEISTENIKKIDEFVGIEDNALFTLFKVYQNCYNHNMMELFKETGVDGIIRFIDDNFKYPFKNISLSVLVESFQIKNLKSEEIESIDKIILTGFINIDAEYIVNNINVDEETKEQLIKVLTKIFYLLVPKYIPLSCICKNNK